MPEQSYSELSQTCSDYLASHRATLWEAVRAGQRGTDVGERHARVFDGVLGSLFCGALSQLRAENSRMGSVALVAVGGYGRRIVAPYSDIDVLFLADDPEDPDVAKLAERVLYPLWNAGVDVGHAVRGLRESLELSQSDIRTATTLLDMRHLSGNRALSDALQERGRQEIFAEKLLDFVASLEQDTRARHDRYGGSLYVREPEIKVGRGGLRDIDVVMWCARARAGNCPRKELVERRLLTEHELEDVTAAEEHLWTVRTRLHLLARRRQERFTFEDQEQLAGGFGYRDGVTSAAEQLLQTHYQHARAIARLVDCIGDRVRRSLRPPPTTIRDLGGGVMIHDGRVTLKSLQLRSEPAVAFRLYHYVARYNLPPDTEARDAIATAATDLAWCQRLRREPEAASLFCRLLMRGDKAAVRRGSLLNEFHELGLLLAMIPEMLAITGRVRHDAYHDYTVDAQSVMAIDYLRALVRGEHAGEYFSVSRCAAEQPRARALYLALLLGGLGTGHPDDPAKYAAAIAGPIAERLGLEPDDVRYTQWLIEHQSMMYHTAMRRDISDPEIIAEFASQVHTTRRMGDLYLFTFCYVATANAAAMTTWNARMLGDLWEAVCAYIENGGAPQEIDHVRAEVLREIEDPSERDRVEAFLATMPDRYLLGNTAERIRFHARMAEECRGDCVFGASAFGDESGGELELVLGCPDRAGLLVDFTAALAVNRFSVDAAEVYTRRCDDRAEAFDVFYVSHPNLGIQGTMQGELEQLRQTLEQLQRRETTAQALMSRRSKPPLWSRTGPRIKTEIHIDNSASPGYSVVDIYTRDRPDLLHLIARAFHEEGLSIDVAKVNTEGERVADVFYVQTAEGGKLSGEGRLSSLSNRLRHTIRELE